MKGKKSLIAVNLILIASLVLSPMAVFAQSEETIPPPETAIAESAPAEQTGSEPAAEVSSGGEAVDNTAASVPVEEPAGGEAAIGTDESVSEVKEETPQTDSVDEPVTEEKTEEEQLEVINEEVQESENTVTDSETNTEETITEEENKTVEETSEEETNTETDPSEQPDETAALSNTEDPAPETKEIELDLAQGNVSINDEGDDTTGRIKITGKDANGNTVDKSASNNSVIRVKQSTTGTISKTISIILKKIESFVTVILDSLNIKSGSSPISVQTAAESTVALELDGKNVVNSTGSNASAIRKSGEGTLVIQDKNDADGELSAETKNSGAATIGGGMYANTASAGTIVISGATVTATKTDGTGAAIGAGKESSVDEIRIENGADVTATAGGYNNGAAIGAGNGNDTGLTGNVGSITISDSKVTATGMGYGAAIGAGKDAGVETITIDNSEVDAKTDGNYSWGAAIGGGKYGDVGSIEIINSPDVKATTISQGAAIGAGHDSTVDKVTIDNSTVTATASYTGAAIGGGHQGGAKVGTITIDNSNVTATGKGYAAAIGGGHQGSVDSITIDNSNVTANATQTAPGTATGAAIGAGQESSATVGTINISNSEVTANGNGYGAAVGGGYNAAVDSVTIDNSNVTATSTYTGAAIGGGYNGSVETITIDNSNVTADAGKYSATLGEGYYGTVKNIIISGKSIINATGLFAAVKVTGEFNTEGLKSVEIVENTKKSFLTKEIEPKSVVVPDQPNEEEKPVSPFIPKTETPVEEEKTDTLVESKKDEDVVHSKIEIEDTTAKITVTDETGEQIEPKEVTIKSVAKFEETGATEAAIQLTTKLIVNVDVETMKEVTAQNGTEDDAVTVTNEDSVITVKSGETALVSVDVKAVVAAVEETVTVKFNRNTVRVICGAAAYHIDLTDLGDVGTLTLRLENGVLKIYDKDGNLLREIASA